MNPAPQKERSRFWRSLGAQSSRRERTPFYLFSTVPIEGALAELDRRFGHLPVRHWLSFKTQPLRPLVQWWRRGGRGVEVVSEFEFLAARGEGFPPERILVNGPAKHHWLSRHPARGLRVNFDSLVEARALAPMARKLGWSTGVRIHTREEFDPETPEHPTPFGMQAGEAAAALKMLRRAKVKLETVHIHLRTNVASPDIYERALREVAGICRSAGFAPLHVDGGGGFPPPFVRRANGGLVAGDFSLREMAEVVERALNMFGRAREFWMENGRWLTARSGALVTSVLEVKERGGMRHLICDAGRTTSALVSVWEDHDLLTLPVRGGRQVLTTVHGPTCMAFDKLARRPLPRGIRAGDRLLWLDAGAYHLPWETRFSHGLIPVLWHDGRRLRGVRGRETFDAWWGQWK